MGDLVCRNAFPPSLRQKFSICCCARELSSRQREPARIENGEITACEQSWSRTQRNPSSSPPCLLLSEAAFPLHARPPRALSLFRVAIRLCESSARESESERKAHTVFASLAASVGFPSLSSSRSCGSALFARLVSATDNFMTICMCLTSPAARATNHILTPFFPLRFFVRKFAVITFQRQRRSNEEH